MSVQSTKSDAGRRTGSKTIALAGISGAGKTATGKVLAQTLGRTFVDLDVAIERRVGLEITEIFERHGEAYFRKCELEVLRDVLEEMEGTVLSLGGGALLKRANQGLLRKRACVVYLKVSCEEAARRLLNSSDRPLLNTARSERTTLTGLKKRLQKLLAERRDGFSLADIKVRVTGKTIQGVSREIVSRLNESGIE